VAAGHEETARAGAIILEAGGNAFDAALGAMLTACIAEPVLASLGGGGFLLADAAGSAVEPVVYDFFAETPIRRRAAEEVSFFPIQADFGETVQEFHIGLGAAAAPGLIPGLFEIWQDLGSLPLSVIAEPAIMLARDGVTITDYQSYLFDVVSPIYVQQPESLACFGGSAASGLTVAGDILRNPDLATVLETLVREGEALGRHGDLATAMASFAADNGGHLTIDDFKNYQVHRRRPIEFDFGDVRVATNPPPSTGGILIAFALRLIEDAWRRDPDPVARSTAVVRAMKATNDARRDSGLIALDDEAFRRLLDPGMVEAYRHEVAGRPAAHRGTTHISVIDGEGNAASLTLSNGEGCGYMVPGCGFMLNNMLGEEDINPRGFHAWPENTRMSSMMAPSLIRSTDGALTVLGSGGSNRIRSALFQVILELADGRLPLSGAIDAPRCHVEGDVLFAENPDDAPLLEESLAMFEEEAARVQLFTDRSMFFGGVHAVRRRGGDHVLEAHGDKRRAGAVRVI